MIGCLNEEMLQAYLDRELDQAVMGRVIKHLAECDWCADNAYEMERAIGLMSDAFDEELSVSVPTERLWQRVNSAVFQPSRNVQSVVNFPTRIERKETKQIRPRTRSYRRLAYASAAALVLAGLVWLGMGSRLFHKEKIALAPEQPKSNESVAIQPASPPESNGDIATNYANRPSFSDSGSKDVNSRRGPHSRPRHRDSRDRGELIDAGLSEVGEYISTADSTTFDPGMIRHFERAQVLLRSFRNSDESVDSTNFDVARERRRSKSLLYENILLRRDAETSGNLPAEEVLGSLEPILLDIANLPEEPSRDEVRSIKERMQRQEIIGVLQVYSAAPMTARN
jgi:hypothetical protein